MSMGREMKEALLKTIPVAAGYLVMGFGFGVLLTARGYPFFWAPVMGLIVYAGSMQFVLIDLLSGGAGIITAAVMTFLINARHLFYGLSMLDEYRRVRRGRNYLIFSLTDETFSIVASGLPKPDFDAGRYYLGVSALDQGYWVAGCLLGGLAGETLPFDFRGIEFSMTALFLVTFMEQWKTARDKLPALIGLGSALLSLIVFGKDQLVLPAMGLILACLLMARKRDIGWMEGPRA